MEDVERCAVIISSFYAKNSVNGQAETKKMLEKAGLLSVANRVLFHGGLGHGGVLNLKIVSDLSFTPQKSFDSISYTHIFPS
jgi:hypothetical protein